MTLSRITIVALPLLALLLSACGARQARPEPVLPVRPQISRCPAYPLPPAELMEPPAIIDFLQTSN